eukprot:scaffold167392_cov31-Tisochrysis_lutea.AAC.3
MDPLRPSDHTIGSESSWKRASGPTVRGAVRPAAKFSRASSAALSARAVPKAFAPRGRTARAASSSNAPRQPDAALAPPAESAAIGEDGLGEYFTENTS